MVSIAKNGLLAGIEFGEPLAFKSLRVVPLVGPSRDDPSYRLFGPDVAGDVEVEEPVFAILDVGDVAHVHGAVTRRPEDDVLDRRGLLELAWDANQILTLHLCRISLHPLNRVIN